MADVENVRCTQCWNFAAFCLCDVVQTPARTFMDVLGIEAEEIRQRLHEALNEGLSEDFTTMEIPISRHEAQRWLDQFEAYILRDDVDAKMFIHEWVAGVAQLVWLWLETHP